MAVADTAYVSGYETEIEHKLLDRDGNDTGVTVWVRSMDCDASNGVHTKYRKIVMEEHVKASGGDVPDGRIGDLVVSEEIDRYVACISRWDFGGEELFEGEGDPVCDDKTKLRFFNIPVFGKQVREWVDAAGAFTPA